VNPSNFQYPSDDVWLALDALDALDASTNAGDGPEPDAEAGDDELRQLLDRVREFGCRFISFPSEEATVAWVLWVTHTHFIDQFDSTPRLALLSPEKGSGKTRVLEVTETLVPRSCRTSHITSAVIYRLIAPEALPTFLLDETDAIWGGTGTNETLRAILNSGHRRGATAALVIKDGGSFKPGSFETFAPVCLAGLGELPDTLMDRSVVIRMQRRSPDRLVERWRFKVHDAEGQELRDLLANLASEGLDLPDVGDITQVSDRQADVWEPLLSIAAAAGGVWPSAASHACQALAGSGAAESRSRGIELLSDLREVWPRESPFVPTGALLQVLGALPESEWFSAGPFRREGLTAKQMGSLLSPYAVTPEHSRDRTCRGYTLAAIETAWTTYLPPREASKASKASPTMPMTVDEPAVADPAPDESTLATMLSRFPGDDEAPIRAFLRQEALADDR
jgi:hypothetical protein